MSDLPRRLTNEEISRVLRRAAELDAELDTLTPRELRQIAAEAGLDPQATELALRETLAAEVAAPPDRGRAVREAGVNAALGGALGYAVSAAPAFGPAGVGAALLYAFTRLVGRDRREGAVGFLLPNTATWLGLFGGAALVAGRTMSELMGLAVLLWVVTSVIGVLVAWRDARG